MMRVLFLLLALLLLVAPARAQNVLVGSSPFTYAVASSPYSTEVLADNPRGYWRLGESTGTVADDETANTFDGTYTSSPTLGAAGLISGGNSSVDFSGGGSGAPYVSLADGNAILTTSQATIECWFRADVLTNKRIIAEFGGLSDGILLHTDGTTLYGVVVDGTSAVSSQATIATGTTYHAAFVWQSGVTMRLYVNGVLSDNDDATSPTSGAAAGSNASGIGAAASGARFADGSTTASSGANGLDGRIDECAAYNTALTQTRIQAHYNTGL